MPVGTVQLFADELDDHLADELEDGAAQLVFDERLERLPGVATSGVFQLGDEAV